MSDDGRRINVDVPNLLVALGIQNWSQNGDEIWAACPLPDHDEIEPSWSIKWDPNSDHNGYHHCFGCDGHGGPVHLVMEVVGLSGYAAAHRWIEENNLLLNRAAPLRVNKVIRGGVVDGLQIPPGVKCGPLDQWATPAKRYAARRGLTPDQVARWGIGYGTIRPLSSRLWLPTYSSDGELLNWAARTFADASPRYLNPQIEDNPVVDSVFGEAFWPENAAHHTLFLTEGELDALAIERAAMLRGLDRVRVGALGGSAVKGESFGGKIMRISRFTRIALAFDPDRAGNKATKRIAATLKAWRKCRQIVLPNKEDPCSWEEKHGAEGVAKLMFRRRRYAVSE